jgi:hypothetical protein
LHELNEDDDSLVFAVNVWYTQQKEKKYA